MVRLQTFLVIVYLSVWASSQARRGEEGFRLGVARDAAAIRH